MLSNLIKLLQIIHKNIFWSWVAVHSLLSCWLKLSIFLSFLEIFKKFLERVHTYFGCLISHVVFFQFLLQWPTLSLFPEEVPLSKSSCSCQFCFPQQPTSHNHSDLHKAEQGRTILHKGSRGLVLLQAAAVTVKKTLEKQALHNIMESRSEPVWIIFPVRKRKYTLP